MAIDSFELKTEIDRNLLKATISTNKINPHYLFYLYKDGNLIKKTEWSKNASIEWELLDSGLYYVAGYLKIITKTIQKQSKPISYFKEAVYQDFEKIFENPYTEKMLNDLVPPFEENEYPYFDFVTITTQSETLTNPLLQVREEWGSGFQLYPLHTLGNWKNQIFTNYIDFEKTDKCLFSGVSQQNEKLVYGCKDLDLTKSQEFIAETTGNFVLIDLFDHSIDISTDYFNFCHLFYYQDEKVSLVSNRYHLLLLIIARLGIKVEMDFRKIKATLSTVDLYFGLHNISNNMDIKGVKQLETFYNIKITETGFHLVENEFYRMITQEYKYNEQEYQNLLEQGKKEIHHDLALYLSDERFSDIYIDLSGGMDSRTVYSALTMSKSDTNKVKIKTLASSENDINIASYINNKYNYPYISKSPRYYTKSLKEQGQGMRSYLMGTMYETVMPFARSRHDSTYNLSGAGGDIVMRPYYSRKYLDKNYESFELLFEEIINDSKRYYITGYDEGARMFEEIYYEQLSNFPVKSYFHKLELQWLMLGNGYHFYSEYTNWLGQKVGTPLQSKKIYKAHLMTLDLFKNIKLHFDVISTLNKDLVGIPFDNNKNNEEYHRIKETLVTDTLEYENLKFDSSKWREANIQKKKKTPFYFETIGPWEYINDYNNYWSNLYENALSKLVFLCEKEKDIKETIGVPLFYYLENNKNSKNKLQIFYNKIASIVDQYCIVNNIDKASTLLAKNLEYPFYVQTENIKILSNDNSMVIDYYCINPSGEYIQLYDNPFAKAPSEKYAKDTIIKGERKIEIEFDVSTYARGEIELFYMEYTSGDRISNINRKTIISSQNTKISETFTASDKAEKYKIAIRFVFNQDARIRIENVVIKNN